MAEEQVENQFFEKPKQDTGTGLFKPYKTIPVTVKIAIALGALAVFALIVYIIPKPEDAELWVVNSGPGDVHLEIAGDGHDLSGGKLLETKVQIEEGFELGAFRGEEAEDIGVELRREKEGVSIVDVGADAAYIVLDVSPLYTGAAVPPTFNVVLVSQPAKVHFLPYPSAKLVRPGREIPEKGSWELKAAQGAKSNIELFKVARVDAKRLADQAALVAQLSAAIIAKNISDLENMRAFIDQNKQDTHDGVVPKIK